MIGGLRRPEACGQHAYGQIDSIQFQLCKRVQSSARRAAEIATHLFLLSMVTELLGRRVGQCYVFEHALQFTRELTATFRFQS